MYNSFEEVFAKEFPFETNSKSCNTREKIIIGLCFTTNDGDAEINCFVAATNYYNETS